MNKATPWIVLLVVLGGLAAWYFFVSPATEDHPSGVTSPASDVSQAPPRAQFPIETAAEPEPDIDTPPLLPLPPLESSDEELAGQLATLVGPEALGRYFVLEQIISRVVATVDSLDSRQVAPLVMPVKPVAGAFMAQGTETLTLHPENAQRYASLVRLAGTADTDRLVGVYQRYYPLFQQAYAELGNPDAYFNDRLIGIIDHLLATPELTGEPELVRHEAVYQYADARLEALSAGQKILLRIGSSNAAVIMEKLAEIRAALTGQN